MPYIHLEKKTNKLSLFGSIAALCKATGIKADNLYTHFGRKENKEFENNQYRIVKANVERSENKTK